MPEIFESLSFARAGGGTPYDFVPNDHQRVTRFAASVAPRGSDTGRMQAHGFNSRYTFFEGLQITHEGKFLGPSAAEIIAEHDAMLAALLGDLTVPPTTTYLGTLTVGYNGWTETASGLVTIDSWSWDLSVDSVAVSPYMISWKCVEPVLRGDTSGNPKHP